MRGPGVTEVLHSSSKHANSATCDGWTGHFGFSLGLSDKGTRLQQKK